MMSPVQSASGSTASGTMASGPAISQMIKINRHTKGRSISVPSVADVKKSRKLSNSCSLICEGSDRWRTCRHLDTKDPFKYGRRKYDVSAFSGDVDKIAT